MRSTALPMLMLVLGLLLAACGANDAPVTTGSGGTSDPGTVVAETTVPEPLPDGAAGLEPARQRWAAAGIDDYSITYRELCFCPETTVTVVVRDGEIVDTTVDQEPGLVQTIEGSTVDDLFDEIQQAIDSDAAEIQATYDQATGRPLRLWIDQSTMIADEEHGIEVQAFVAEVGGDAPSSSAASDRPGSVAPSGVTTGTSQQQGRPVAGRS